MGTNSAALAAYRALVDLARVDGTIDSEERALLARYRHALGLESETVELAELEPAGAPDADFSHDEGLEVLAMLVRVAEADDRLDEPERRRLEQVARRLSVGPVQFAGILSRVEAERSSRRSEVRFRRGLVWTVALVLPALALAIWLVPRRGTEAPELRLLRERIDQLALERATLDEELVRRSLEEGPGLAAFKRIEARFEPSVLLIVVSYDLVRDDDVATQWSSGTGFFVTPDGLIVTNKHVVQPWKFSADAALLLEQGFLVDETSVHYGAWPGGSSLIDEQGTLDVESGYFNGAGTLALARVTEDRFEPRPAELQDGSTRMAVLHALGPGDLALLAARVREPVLPFTLPRTLPGVEKLDPVVVLGFPRGIAILEGTTAVPSAAMGEVSKIETSILITAPVVPGNSGGPVVDRHGHVVGVATMTPGEGLGTCLRAQEFLELLPDAAELIARARRSLDEHRAGAAAAFVDLAERRGPDEAERGDLAELRARLDDEPGDGDPGGGGGP